MPFPDMIQLKKKQTNKETKQKSVIVIFTFEQLLQKSHLYSGLSGLEINEKIQSQFCDRISKFSLNLATFSRRIFTLHFHVSGLAKLNTSPQYLRVKKTLKMATDRKNATVPVFNAMFKRSNIAAKLRNN